MEQASALALALYGRELQQMGKPLSMEELSKELYRQIQPHQNRGSIQNRYEELTAQFQAMLTKTKTPGIRSEAEKRELAEGWLELAVSFAKIPIKYEAEELKQWQKLQHDHPPQAMTM